jgi:hypothetical protein
MDPPSPPGHCVAPWRRTRARLEIVNFRKKLKTKTNQQNTAQG